MCTKRGALLVFEGCDRAGKTTQAKKLVEALNANGIPAKTRSFPDRSTVVGEIINKFLTKNIHLPPETIHLLFSANRWEYSEDIINTLKSGVTLVLDRYAASGAAYTAANTNKDLKWCKESDRGLPRPDLVFLFKINESNLNSRENWGVEKFENTDFQKKVSLNFEKLMDEKWIVIDANQTIDKIHSILYNDTVKLIENVSNTPIEFLYES
ncbi:thymidylate kinase isoform X2 [Prorops nasuta]